METRICTLPGGISLPLLISERMPAGFRHGFTTRHGGVSLAPYASLNLGQKWGDDAARVAENNRRLLFASGAAVMSRATQVHGTHIVLVPRDADSDPSSSSAESADGLCTEKPGLALSVYVADCTPILMACPVTGACAALHAGWRGTLAGMARAGVEAMRAHFGCYARDLRVALGPCIGVCCFEVGREVGDAFAAALSPSHHRGAIVCGTGTKPHIDLRRVQRLDLEAAGVQPDHIDVSEACTFCDPGQRFYSFRRDGRSTGQSAGFILRV